jgi:galactonate dehydratase
LKGEFLLKITDIKQYLFNVSGPYTRNLHFVKVETDEGIYGFGEATLRVKAPAIWECINLLKPHLIGLPVYNVEDWFNRYFTWDAWRNGVIMNTAISGVEMACWDAMGKKMNLPVYAMIGGKVRDSVELYTHMTNVAPTKNPEDYAEVAKKLVDQGFTGFKVDPIGKAGAFGKPLNEGEVHPTITRQDMEECVAAFAAIREAVGPKPDLFLECHGKLTFDQSLWLVRQLEPYNLGFIEEPMQPDNWEGFRKLAYKSNIPIATGERLFMRWGQRRLIEEGIASIIQPDFSHTGGILESKKISAIAEAYYMQVAPHNSSGPTATMAAVHVDATNPNFYRQEFPPANIELMPKLYKKYPVIKDSHIILDDSAPGLGLEPDLELLENSQPYAQNMKDW